MAVAGDSVGGGMTAALALLAAERGDVRFIHQSMYYPVTDAAMATGSYRQFAEGYFLTAKSMEWFWDAYLPDAGRRAEPCASPLRASDARSSTGFPRRWRSSTPAPAPLATEGPTSTGNWLLRRLGRPRVWRTAHRKLTAFGARVLIQAGADTKDLG